MNSRSPNFVRQLPDPKYERTEKKTDPNKWKKIKKKYFPFHISFVKLLTAAFYVNGLEREHKVCAR